MYALGVLLYQVLIGDFDEPLGTGWEETLPDRESTRMSLLANDIRESTRTDVHRRLSSVTVLAERLRTLGEPIA